MPRKRGVYRQLDITKMVLLVADSVDEKVFEMPVTVAGRCKDKSYLRKMAMRAMHERESVEGQYTLLEIRSTEVARERYMMPEEDFYNLATRCDAPEREAEVTGDGD